MEFETIIYQLCDEEKIAWVTMNRPDKKNAINKKMIEEMSQAFRHAEANENVRVILFNGNGSCFSSGHDLSASENYPTTSEERIKWERKYYFDEIMYVRNIRKPVISLVHSYCIAAGFVLALMADIVIASEDAVFFDPVVKWGANSQEVLVLPWLIGEKKTKELLFTGDKLTADEAERLGMINKVVPREELEKRGLEFAKKIGSMPPMGISLMKESINNAFDQMGFTSANKMHFASHLLSHSTEEMKQGLGQAKR